MRSDVQIDRNKHAKTKYLLSLAGLSFVDIAKTLELNPATVSAVSMGKARSARVEEALAKAIGHDVREYFSDRYPDFEEQSMP